MKRRKFLATSTLSAVAISMSGYIQFDGRKFIGNCETTTDILGPYYRPNSPVRSNLNVAGHQGTPIHLYGKILHDDCSSPCDNAKVEIWHCDENGVYDNTTSDFNYRGTVFTNSQGEYNFETILPVPYDAGGGLIRPAHYHMMVTANGYQTLVTQLYFSGDDHVNKDPWASREEAKNRVLDVNQDSNGGSKVEFNVGLSQKLAIGAASLDQLIGIYQVDEGVNSTIEIVENNGKLWQKNGGLAQIFEYLGNNTFEVPGLTNGTYNHLKFNILASGSILMKQETYNQNSGLRTTQFHKTS